MCRAIIRWRFPGHVKPYDQNISVYWRKQNWFLKNKNSQESYRPKVNRFNFRQSTPRAWENPPSSVGNSGNANTETAVTKENVVYSNDRVEENGSSQHRLSSSRMH